MDPSQRGRIAFPAIVGCRWYVSIRDRIGRKFEYIGGIIGGQVDPVVPLQVLQPPGDVIEIGFCIPQARALQHFEKIVGK